MKNKKNILCRIFGHKRAIGLFIDCTEAKEKEVEIHTTIKEICSRCKCTYSPEFGWNDDVNDLVEDSNS